MDVIFNLADTITVLNHGKIIGQGHRGMTTNEANALSAGLTSTSAEEILNWYEEFLIGPKNF